MSIVLKKGENEFGSLPDKRFDESARNLRFGRWNMAGGISPVTRPGTSERSVNAVNRPIEAGSVPARPGEPARGSPRERETMRPPEQETPVKVVQGSVVKSQLEKKVEPGRSDMDRWMDCRVR